MILDAASKAVFNISADVQLAEGSNAASFILGADDFRLKNEAFNVDLQNGENYVRVELDFSGATDAGSMGTFLVAPFLQRKWVKEKRPH